MPDDGSRTHLGAFLPFRDELEPLFGFFARFSRRAGAPVSLDGADASAGMVSRAAALSPRKNKHPLPGYPTLRYDPRGARGDLSAYILMQRIFPPTNQTLCLRKGEMVALETLSELGIYGGYVRVGEAVTRNAHGGHLLRTKAATSDEGGVAAGFAVLDSVVLEG